MCRFLNNEMALNRELQALESYRLQDSRLLLECFGMTDTRD